MKIQSATLLALLLLSGCGETAEPIETEQVEGAEELGDGVVVSNARMVLAPVKGNPAAVYFDITYGGDASVTLESASVEDAASAMIHQVDEVGRMTSAGPLELTPGETFEFKPGGFHVMAMQVAPEVEAGGTTSVTLTLPDGTTHSFDAEVRAAGEER